MAKWLMAKIPLIELFIHKSTQTLNGSGVDAQDR